MISIQRNSLARSGTYSIVEVDRGRLEYIRGKCWIRFELLDQIQTREQFLGGYTLFFIG